MNITFKKKQATEKSLTYVDVDLMLENKAIVNVELNKKNEKDDLNVLTDINSVKNRLKTLFSTKRAQKHLDFNYGCDLSQFLFEPNTDVLRNNIGDEILNQIKRYEPGITVTHVDVKPN